MFRLSSGKLAVGVAEPATDENIECYCSELGWDIKEERPWLEPARQAAADYMKLHTRWLKDQGKDKSWSYKDSPLTICDVSTGALHLFWGMREYQNYLALREHYEKIN